MASVYGLIEVLDRAQDIASLEAALRGWSATLAPACTVDVQHGPDAQTSSTISVHADGDRTVITLPAPSEDPTSLAFKCPTSADRITESFRRMLVVAGRLFGSELGRLRRLEVADGEVSALRQLSFGTATSFLGSSLAAQQLAARLPRLSASDVSVLIEGETGVGKTFVARLVHEASGRAKEPLRVINCAAIPENLLESELFGHEKGSFTGAAALRVGALEAAGRGTVFLDEVGELPLASQAKLLRVVEERKFERVGSNRTIDFRARLLCATNRDLEKMVAAGEFRQDLLFRIAVVRVRVPALRERAEDIPQLAEQLLSDAARSTGRRVRGFSPAAMHKLSQYGWPGNVRELRNAIEHGVALGEGPLVRVEDLPPGLTPIPEQPSDPELIRLPLDMVTLERRAMEAALRSTNGNRFRAAALLGMNRSTFYNKLKEHGIG
jgi:DNA-binding NtrC family response regulator